MSAYKILVNKGLLNKSIFIVLLSGFLYADDTDELDSICSISKIPIVNAVFDCRRLTNKEIARRVLNMEKDNPVFKKHRVHAGPADSAIYTVENGHSVADDMKAVGVRWRRADKSAGSRVAGWQVIIQMMKNALNKEDSGLYFFGSCEHSQRLIPVTPRDDKNMDDIDTDFEDHLQDALRYRLRKKKNKGKTRQL